MRLTPCEIILILLLKNIFHQKIPRNSGIAVNIQLISSTNVFYHQPVVLTEVSKMNDSVMNKNHRNQTQFSPEKKTSEKGKWVCYYLNIRYLLSNKQKTNKQTI